MNFLPEASDLLARLRSLKKGIESNGTEAEKTALVSLEEAERHLAYAEEVLAKLCN